MVGNTCAGNHQLEKTLTHYFMWQDRKLKLLGDPSLKRTKISLMAMFKMLKK